MAKHSAGPSLFDLATTISIYIETHLPSKVTWLLGLLTFHCVLACCWGCISPQLGRPLALLLSQVAITSALRRGAKATRPREAVGMPHRIETPTAYTVFKAGSGGAPAGGGGRRTFRCRSIKFHDLEYSEKELAAAARRVSAGQSRGVLVYVGPGCVHVTLDSEGELSPSEGEEGIDGLEEEWGLLDDVPPPRAALARGPAAGVMDPRQDRISVAWGPHVARLEAGPEGVVQLLAPAPNDAAVGPPPRVVSATPRAFSADVGCRVQVEWEFVEPGDVALLLQVQGEGGNRLEIIGEALGVAGVATVNVRPGAAVGRGRCFLRVVRRGDGPRSAPVSDLVPLVALASQGAAGEVLEALGGEESASDVEEIVADLGIALEGRPADQAEALSHSMLRFLASRGAGMAASELLAAVGGAPGAPEGLLACAVGSRSAAAVASLAEAGAPMGPSVGGRSPLHAAAVDADPSILAALLGARGGREAARYLDARDGEGRTPADAAMGAGLSAHADMLRRAAEHSPALGAAQGPLLNFLDPSVEREYRGWADRQASGFDPASNGVLSAVYLLSALDSRRPDGGLCNLIIAGLAFVHGLGAVLCSVATWRRVWLRHRPNTGIFLLSAKGISSLALINSGAVLQPTWPATVDFVTRYARLSTAFAVLGVLAAPPRLRAAVLVVPLVEATKLYSPGAGMLAAALRHPEADLADVTGICASWWAAAVAATLAVVFWRERSERKAYAALKWEADRDKLKAH